MTRPIAISALMIAGFIFLHGQPAAAQGVASGYRPDTPTLSPWLDLYQRKGAGGPLDPYHQFVRPELDLRETLRQQDLTNQRQGADVSTLSQQLTQMEQERLTQVRPTGTGSVYMNYSHYYYPNGGGAGRALPMVSPQWIPQGSNQGNRGAWSAASAGSNQTMGTAGRGF